VRNMPGGGTMIAANYVYGVAKRWHHPGIDLSDALFRPAYRAKRSQIRWAKFTWIGSRSTTAAFSMHALTDTKLGGHAQSRGAGEMLDHGVGTSSHYIPKLIEEIFWAIKLTLVTVIPAAQNRTWRSSGRSAMPARASSTFFGRNLFFLA